MAIIHKNKTTNKHAQNRATERYQINADELLVNDILSRIRQGKGKLLQYDKNGGRKIFKVTYKKTYIVLVNNNIDHIITFLPKDAIENRI